MKHKCSMCLYFTAYYTKAFSKICATVTFVMHSNFPYAHYCAYKLYGTNMCKSSKYHKYVQLLC